MPDPLKPTTNAPHHVDPGRRAQALLLILLMALGSVSLWIGAPVGWLWIGSQAVDSSQPSAGAYMLVIVGLAVTVVILGKGLGMLDRRYRTLMAQDEGPRIQMPWLRSMRGEREVHRRESVLDVVMIISVGLAVVALGIWFAFFAGSPLPS